MDKATDRYLKDDEMVIVFHRDEEDKDTHNTVMLFTREKTFTKKFALNDRVREQDFIENHVKSECIKLILSDYQYYIRCILERRFFGVAMVGISAEAQSIVTLWREQVLYARAVLSDKGQMTVTYE